jgi:hypothetical protein
LRKYGLIFKAISSSELDLANARCAEKLSEFIEQLTSSQFKEVEKFFATMPKLSHTLKIKNPNTGVESEVLLEGLSSFFA